MSRGHNFLSLVNVQSLGHTRIYTLLLLPSKAVFFTSTRQDKDKCFGPYFIHVSRCLLFKSSSYDFRIKTILLDIQDIDITLLKFVCKYI